MYYETFLNSINPDSSIIPESASFDDMGIFTNRHIQDAYNEVSISLAYNEMALFESVMLEADDNKEVGNPEVQKALAAKETENKKKILDYIKEFFKKIWEGIKGFFQKLIAKIKAYFDNAKRKQIDNMLKKFDIAIKSVDSSEEKTYGEIIPPTVAYGAMKGLLKGISDLEQFARKIYGKLGSAENASAADDIVKSELSEDAILDVVTGGLKTSTKLKSLKLTKLSSDAMISSLATEKITNKNISTYAPKIKTLVKNINEWINNIKKAYNETKKTIDTLMNDAKKLTNVNKSAVKSYCSACRTILSYLSQAVSGTNGAFKKAYNDSLRMVNAVISDGKKAGANFKDVKESVENSESYDPFEEEFKFFNEEDEAEVESPSSDDVEETEVDFELED